MKNPGIEFLNKVYRDLYKSPEVMIKIDDKFVGNKIENILKYIDRLSYIHDMVANSDDRDKKLKILKKFYYKKYIIKECDIPYKYKNISLNIINDQKKSLDIWIEYFTSKDSQFIPCWQKYLIFQSILTIGNIDKKNNTFTKRNNKTITKFIDFNAEALAKAVDLIQKYINAENITDNIAKEFLENRNFSKLYIYTLNKLNNDLVINSDILDGKWIKYARGTNHMLLVNSIQGYNTGWCSAGEMTAKNQLSAGDFYVYYTKNKNAEFKVPRIAIRMYGDVIAEIRGVSFNQNIEEGMETVIESILENEFPNQKNIAIKKINDMKLLSEIDEKNRQGLPLDSREVIFLYEVLSTINGFGYSKDPRISKIISTRNITEDIKKIEFPNIVYGNINLSYLIDCEDVKLPEKIIGSLDLSNLEKINNITLPKYISGDLDLSSIKHVGSLDLSNCFIGGGLFLDNLIDSKELKLPSSIGGNLDLSGLKEAENLKLPDNIGSDLDLRSLKNLENVNMPISVGRHLDLSGLKKCKDVVMPQNVGGNLNLKNIKSVENLKLPMNVGWKLDLGSLVSAKTLIMPKTIGRDLNLSSLIDSNGIIMPDTIGRDLHLNSLKEVEKLKLPTWVGGNLNLGNLKSIKGIIMPKNVGGSVNLSNLEQTDILTLPISIGNYLDLGNLIDIKGIIMPRKIGGSLNLGRLVDAEELMLPNEVGEYLDLGNLTNVDKLIMPKIIGRDLYLNSLKSYNEIIMPEYVGGSIIGTESIPILKKKHK